jgi:hypothetical protein
LFFFVLTASSVPFSLNRWLDKAEVRPGAEIDAKEYENTVLGVLLMKQGDIHCDKLVAGTEGRDGGEEYNPENAVLAAAEAAEIAAHHGGGAMDTEEAQEDGDELDDGDEEEEETTDVYHMMMEPTEEQVLIIDASSSAVSHHVT